MANKLTISYNGSNIVNEAEIEGDAAVTYNGSTITSITAGATKTLNCAGKVMRSNVIIGGKTLNCSGKIMSSNVGISVATSYTYIYKAGYTAWQNVSEVSSSANSTTTFGSSSVTITGSVTLKIPNSSYSGNTTLVIKGKTNSSIGSDFQFSSSTTLGNDVVTEMPKSSTIQTFKINIFKMTGDKYLRMDAGYNSTLTITEIYFENDSDRTLRIYTRGDRAFQAGTVVSDYSQGYSFKSDYLQAAGGGTPCRISISGIDFTNYSKLHIGGHVNIAGEIEDETMWWVGYGTEKRPDLASGRVTQAIEEVRRDKIFDISNVSGTRYIYIYAWNSGTAYMPIYHIWLE